MYELVGIICKGLVILSILVFLVLLYGYYPSLGYITFSIALFYGIFLFIMDAVTKCK